MYYKGEGVPQDYTSAVGWYRKAAEQGFARAQADLGYMYSEGEGCPRDYVESARWYRKAAGQGDQYAQRALDSMNIRLSVVTKVNLSIAFLFSVLLLISSTGKIRNREQRKVTLGGLVLLLWVGLTVYGDFHVGFLQSLSAVNTFHLSRGLLSGIGIAMLVSFVWPEGIKLVLSMCGILFIAFNVYATTHFHLRHFADCPRAFYSINGLLIGMAITTTVLSLESRRAGGSQNGNAAEPATELLQT